MLVKIEYRDVLGRDRQETYDADLISIAMTMAANHLDMLRRQEGGRLPPREEKARNLARHLGYDIARD